jgi:hypothetical protein
MPFNVQKFAANIRQFGTLQNNRYDVIISPSNELANILGTNVQALLNMRSDSVMLPGLNFSLYENRRYGVGPLIKTATNVSFSEVGISFIETSNQDIFKIFYAWSKQIVNLRSNNFEVAYKDSISAKIQIRVYNNSGTANASRTEGPVAVIELIDAFPTTVSDTQLSWSDNNTVFKLNVSFAYTSWRIEETVATTDNSVTREDLPPLPGARVSDTYNPSREIDDVARTLDTLRELQRFRQPPQ